MALKPIILHADLDCFYCQVEKLRLDLPDDLPMAVQQWSNVIAVNYPARSRGVSRHLSSAECIKQCPEMVFVHVPTYSIRQPGEVFRYPAKGKTDKEPVPLGADRAEHKASLAPYRKASLEIFKVFQRFAVVLEKGGLDEAFLDITKKVDDEFERIYGCTPSRADIIREDLDWDGLGVPAINEDESSDVTEDIVNDIRIWLGAKIALELRHTLRDELGYACSIGIAHNKMLAKLGSARNKPFNQTYILDRMVSSLMKQVPLKKIRFLGGKLGALLCNTAPSTQAAEEEDDFGADFESDDEGDLKQTTVMASDIWTLSVNELSYKLDGDLQSAEWIYGIIRGIDSSPVTPRSKPKSFMAAKSLRPALKEWSLIEQWLKLLSLEIWERLDEDYQVNARWPKTINLTYKSFGNEAKSQSTDFPIFSPSLYSLDILVGFLIKLMHASNVPVFPCHRITIAVSRFAPLLEEDNGRRWSTMDRFTRKRGQFEEVFAAPIKAPKLAPTSNYGNGLLKYFSTKNSCDFNNECCDEWRCKECTYSISMFEIDRIQEHQDYHLACKLSN